MQPVPTGEPGPPFGGVDAQHDGILADAGVAFVDFVARAATGTMAG